jgi:CHAT domain-containing protein/cytochrome c-type biogenesis protein CcmH/NrfG
LTGPFDKHLDSDELDKLVSLQETSVSGSGQLSEPALREAQRHVESCQDCSRKVQRHRSVQSEILRMRAPKPLSPTPECVGYAEWLEVVAGLFPEAKTRELMKHAAQCGHCGPLLKNAAETISDEATPSEEDLLASLRSAQPEWRKNMAARLRGSVQQGQQKRSWWPMVLAWPTPAYLFAAVAVVTIVTWIGIRTLHPPTVGQLLAQAYSEHRTLEVRIPGAKYAPMQAQRGTERSDFDKPQSLLKAEALIGENLSKNPNDPAWLQARARADLLNGNYDSAIKSLQRTLETQPDSPGLLTDLGSAYFVRAESADRPIDYGNAIESFGKALTKSPDDPIALFNRALACEQMFLYTQAIDDWEHYLRVDPQGEWAEDARKRLADIKQKKERRERSLAEPLLTPEYIAHAYAHGSDLGGKIDERIEEYLKVATTDWLPTAFSDVKTEQSRSAQVAVAAVAQITRGLHQDTWLSDLLSRSAGEQFRLAIEALAMSVRANEDGDYVQARESAHRAAELFRSAANPAGQLRAEAEEVYSDHLLYEGDQCLLLLRKLKEPLKHAHYAWLHGQTDLEESNCSNLVGDLGTYETAIKKGTQEAKKYNYTALFLRGLGFQAQAASSLGDENSGFSLASRGLALFWSSGVDLIKGYNLYTDLDTAADELRLPNLQVALWREATALVDLYPDMLQRAMAHRWYANAAYLANIPSLAETEFANARGLFLLSPQTAATTRRRMDAEIWLAQLETRRGDLDRAASRLQEMRPVLATTPSFVQEIRFYDALAEIALKRGDVVAADSALRFAIYLSERALDSFHGESGRRQWVEATKGVYRNLVEWKLRQGDANSALELWEWYRGAELRAKNREYPIRSLDAHPAMQEAPELPSPLVVANRLPLLRDETVVAYGTFYDGIQVWVYDDRGVFSHWISIPLPIVQEQTDRLRRLCSDPTSDLATLRKTALSLYKLLVLPVEERLVPGRTLVFEPDDFLEAVPWGALVDQSQHYLAERASIVVTPGLYLAIRLRPSTLITVDSPSLVVGVSSAPEEGLTPLNDAENEAKAVAERFSDANQLQGSTATLSAIRNGLPGSVLFHFAGHAIDSPQHSGLVLAELDPKTGRSRLIESLDTRETANLQLAVLSACHTSEESHIGSSGTESLTESLLRSGVPRVVAARWNVDSAQTAKLMESFYDRLLAGNDVANSMRIAQLAVASNPDYAHPYYWSAFEVEGTK